MKPAVIWGVGAGALLLGVILLALNSNFMRRVAREFNADFALIHENESRAELKRKATRSPSVRANDKTAKTHALWPKQPIDQKQATMERLWPKVKSPTTPPPNAAKTTPPNALIPKAPAAEPAKPPPPRPSPLQQKRGARSPKKSERIHGPRCRRNIGRSSAVWTLIRANCSW